MMKIIKISRRRWWRRKRKNEGVDRQKYLEERHQREIQFETWPFFEKVKKKKKKN